MPKPAIRHPNSVLGRQPHVLFTLWGCAASPNGVSERKTLTTNRQHTISGARRVHSRGGPGTGEYIREMRGLAAMRCQLGLAALSFCFSRERSPWTIIKVQCPPLIVC
jgi:hypothetical protein